MKNLFITLAVSFALSCCAGHPEKVPELNTQTLPALQIPSLKPQTVSFSLKNTRAINLKAGNTQQVEVAVQTAVIQSLTRGGITVNPDSKNAISLEIDDCPNIDPNLECVTFVLGLKTPRYEVEVSGTTQNGLQHEGGSTIPGSGDVSKAYQDGLAMVLQDLPRQVVKILSKQH